MWQVVQWEEPHDGNAVAKTEGASVGAGYFARFQHEAWSRIPEVEIVAVCDQVEDKARAVQEQFGIANRYTRWTEMLDSEKPDFIDIITPPDTHKRYAPAPHAAEFT